jgi:hypothetical protein
MQQRRTLSNIRSNEKATHLRDPAYLFSGGAQVFS